MRTRSKNVTYSRSSTGLVRWWKYADPSYTDGAYPHNGGLVVTGDTIVDEVLPKSDVRTRNVTHLTGRSWPEVKSFTLLHRDHETDPDRHVYTDINLPYYLGSVLGFTGIYDRTWCKTKMRSYKDPAFNSRAYEAMLPSLGGDVSLTNFLLELIELRLLLRFFRQYGPEAHTVADQLRDVLKKVSEGHLTWAFGIRPFIGDLQEIWNTLFNYEKRLKDFLARRNKPQKRFYSESGEDKGTDADSYDGTYLFSITSESEWSVKWKRVATMSYTYDCADIQTRIDKLKALRDMLGLRFTPSVIWEAIPFSFVVDWFLGVGKFLESIENDLIVPDVIITDYSVSYKSSISAHVNCTFNQGGYSGPAITHGLRWYERRRALPDTGGTPLSLSGLGPNQLALSASLIHLSLGRR